MSDRYFWINEFNMVEMAGPFESVEQAKANAVEVSRALRGGMCKCVTIVRAVESGEILVDQQYAWKSISDEAAP